MSDIIIIIIIITFTVFLMNINQTFCCGQSQAATGGMISIEGLTNSDTH